MFLDLIAHENGSPRHFIMKRENLQRERILKASKEEKGKKKTTSWHGMGLFHSNILSNTRKQRRNFFRMQRDYDF